MTDVDNDSLPPPPPAAAAVLGRHRALSNDIGRWLAIANELVNEMHAKKAVWRRNHYVFGDRRCRRVYRDVLFRGGDNLTSTFPLAFDCELDAILYAELARIDKAFPSRFDYERVYYDRRTRKLAEADWTLSTSPRLDAHDLAVLTRFRVGLLACMRRCLDVIAQATRLPASESARRAQHEYARVERLWRRPM